MNKPVRNRWVVLSILLFCIMILSVSMINCGDSGSTLVDYYIGEYGDGGDGGIDEGEMKLPPEAKQAAEALLDSVLVQSTARVIIAGPVEPGTLLRQEMALDEETDEEILEEEPVELMIPDTPGKYYVFFIDDEPNMMFAHSIRFAWLNLDTGEVASINASLRMTIYRPGIEPSPFVMVGSEYVKDVEFYFMDGEGAPEITDVSHKPPFQLEVRYPKTSDNLDDDSLDRQVARSPVKFAFVVDAGDYGWPFNWMYNYADNMAEDADSMGNWLEEYNFIPSRASNYSGNNYPKVYPYNILKTIEDFGKKFTDLGEPAEGCDEFFLYIFSHQELDPEEDDGRLQIYKADGSAFFPLAHSQILKTINGYEESNKVVVGFPKWVKVTIFLDSCYSGKLITGNEILVTQLCDKLCGVTLLTTTDRDTPTTAPTLTHDSATEDFHEGANADLDGDGNIGDIKDRFFTMKNEVGGANPQWMHCPEDDDTWCSLDGPQTGMELFFCGDGIKNSIGEECDGNDFGGATCVSLGFSGGDLKCDSNCYFDKSGCMEEVGLNFTPSPFVYEFFYVSSDCMNPGTEYHVADDFTVTATGNWSINDENLPPYVEWSELYATGDHTGQILINCNKVYTDHQTGSFSITQAEPFQEIVINFDITTW